MVGMMSIDHQVNRPVPMYPGYTKSYGLYQSPQLTIERVEMQMNELPRSCELDYHYRRESSSTESAETKKVHFYFYFFVPNSHNLGSHAWMPLFMPR